MRVGWGILTWCCCFVGRKLSVCASSDDGMSASHLTAERQVWYSLRDDPSCWLAGIVLALPKVAAATSLQQPFTPTTFADKVLEMEAHAPRNTAGCRTSR